MATAFNKNYTELANVNSGNQLQNGDNILANHVNVALQNTAHFKELTNNAVIRSATLTNNTIHLVLATKTNTGNVTTTNLDIDISSLNGAKKQVTSGVYTSYIYNDGDEIRLKSGNGNDDYTLRLRGNGDLELIQEDYDEESEITTVSTYQLIKYPCFVKITHNLSNAEIYVSTIAEVSFSSYTVFLRKIPTEVSIQATGKFDEAGHTYSVYSLKIYDNYIEVTGMRVINGEFSPLTKQIISSQLTITGSIKIF